VILLPTTPAKLLLDSAHLVLLNLFKIFILVDQELLDEAVDIFRRFRGVFRAALVLRLSTAHRFIERAIVVAAYHLIQTGRVVFKHEPILVHLLRKERLPTD